MDNIEKLRNTTQGSINHARAQEDSSALLDITSAYEGRSLPKKFLDRIVSVCVGYDKPLIDYVSARSEQRMRNYKK